MALPRGQERAQSGVQKRTSGASRKEDLGVRVGRVLGLFFHRCISGPLKQYLAQSARNRRLLIEVKKYKNH